MAEESPKNWTIEQLRGELRRFAIELTEAGLRPNSVDTYVGEANTSSDGSPASMNLGDRTTEL